MLTSVMKIPHRKPQRGGTLLGLILGALLGLGLALAVAVYITKVPAPFMNKSPTRNPELDANEIRKNKDWDPNAPLAGKNNVRSPAVPASTPSTASGPVEGTPPAATLPATTAAPSAPAAAAASTPKADPVPKPSRPASVAVSADPLGDLVKAKAGAAPSATAGTAGSVADPFNYFIQVGAFRTPEDAEQQRAKLLLAGFQAKVSEREQSGRAVFRVRLGPYDKKEEADKVKEKLDGSAFETALVRAQR